MSDENKETTIKCMRFGGYRYAASCVSFDRYRACRRRCPTLQKLMEDEPDFATKTAEKMKDRPEQPLLSAKFAGSNLPDAKLACRYCNFIAKTERGLRVHMKRSHGK